MPQLFNFDTPIERRNTCSVKWDEAEPSVLPLWVADMDFATAPCVQEAIVKRAMHPCYGYTLVPDAYYEAIIGWFWQRHNWHIRRQEILYTIGVVPAIAAILKAMTQMGDNVVMLTPAYNCFFSCVRNAGCCQINVPLIVSGDACMRYTIDWERLESVLALEKSSVLLLCNPHNPVGRLWTRDELQTIASLCQKHHVQVICDEIHNELTAPGSRYTPWGTIGEEWQAMAAICTSPSKSFNIAGLQNANIVVRDAALRRRIDRAINLNETCDVNPFGVEAVIAAYREGAPWLEALCQYIWGNYTFACAYLNKELPGIRIAELQATYLMWIDISHLLPSMPKADLSRRLQDEAHVWFAQGTTYGPEGEGCLRINLATTRTILSEALTRFAAWVKKNS